MKKTSSPVHVLSIHAGLAHGIVLQRNAKNVSEGWIRGTVSSAGRLRLVACLGNKTVFNSIVGKVKSGNFRLRWRGLKVGGPYTVTLSLEGPEDELLASVSLKEVRVGDVWLLGGQSNMQGCGLRTGAAKAHPQVRAFFMDDRWAVARDPIHNLWDAVDPVHMALNGGVRGSANPRVGVGPGVAFGQSMYGFTGVPQGMIACAHGGTSMSQWDPALQDQDGNSLFGAMLRRLEVNGGRVAGMIWYQGESDANQQAHEHYTRRMVALVKAVRKATGDTRLPIAMVQLGRVTNWPSTLQGGAPWNSVQEQQRLLPGTIKHLAVVPAVDLELDDPIHISGSSQQILGQRLAEAMAWLKGNKKSQPLPELGRLSLVANPERPECGALRITFKNSIGKLVATGRPQGFFLFSGQGVMMHYATRIEKNAILLLTVQPLAQMKSYRVGYGLTTDPYCNVRDQAGRPLPVFGPLELEHNRSATPFARSWRIARLKTDFSQLRSQPCWPKQDSALVTTDDFANLREDIEKQPVGTYLLRTRFTLSEPMRIQALLGYDGPVAAWLDDQPVYRDVNGTNPAWMDQGKGKPLLLKPGKHTITIALGTQNGNAWGVFLRLIRKDKSPSKKSAPALPAWC
jgi:hypothetical protein